MSYILYLKLQKIGQQESPTPRKLLDWFSLLLLLILEWGCKDVEGVFCKKHIQKYTQIPHTSERRKGTENTLLKIIKSYFGKFSLSLAKRYQISSLPDSINDLNVVPFMYEKLTFISHTFVITILFQ